MRWLAIALMLLLAAPAAAKPVTPDQEAFGRQTLKAFLDAGLDFDAYVVKRKGRTALFIIGYLNRATVHQIMTRLDLAESARGAGIETIEFSGKGGGGVWLFDLKQRPTCSDGICF